MQSLRLGYYNIHAGYLSGVSYPSGISIRDKDIDLRSSSDNVYHYPSGLFIGDIHVGCSYPRSISPRDVRIADEWISQVDTIPQMDVPSGCDIPYAHEFCFSSVFCFRTPLSFRGAWFFSLWREGFSSLFPYVVGDEIIENTPSCCVTNKQFASITTVAGF